MKLYLEFGDILRASNIQHSPLNFTSTLILLENNQAVTPVCSDSRKYISCSKKEQSAEILFDQDVITVWTTC